MSVFSEGREITNVSFPDGDFRFLYLDAKYKTGAYILIPNFMLFQLGPSKKKLQGNAYLWKGERWVFQAKIGFLKVRGDVCRGNTEYD